MYKLNKSVALFLMVTILPVNIDAKLQIGKSLRKLLKNDVKLVSALAGPIAGSFIKKVDENGFKGPLVNSSEFIRGLRHNFYKVEGYDLYRSQQLGYDKEVEYISKTGTKLVLNLRGEHPEEIWGQEQERATQDTKTSYICAQTSENQFPRQHEMHTMLAVIHNPRGVMENPIDARKNPLKYVFAHDASTKDSQGKEIVIKVNCKAGADRTGMFCALFILERELRPNMDNETAYQVLKRAQKELSVKYWHLKISHPTMDNFIVKWWKLRKGKTLEQALELYKSLLDT